MNLLAAQKIPNMPGNAHGLGGHFGGHVSAMKMITF